MRGKKSQAMFIGIMMFIVLFITIVQFINPLKTQIIDARGITNLDCSNASISVGQKMTCVVIDITLFYFVGIGIAAAGGFLTSRFVQSRI